MMKNKLVHQIQARPLKSLDASIGLKDEGDRLCMCGKDTNRALYPSIQIGISKSITFPAEIFTHK